MPGYAEVLGCYICKKKFTQKSSLVRHLKWCGTRASPAGARQKACRICVVSRARCSLERPTCSRCVSRGLECNYNTPRQRSSNLENVSKTPASQDQHKSTSPDSQSLPASQHENPTLIDRALASSLDIATPEGTGGYDTCQEIGYNADRPSSCEVSSPTSVDTPPIPELIKDWMIVFVPQPPVQMCDTTPILAKHSMQTLLRTFRTWPRMIAKGFQLPPIFHPSIAILDKPLPQPLSNCFTVVKMWDGQCYGSSAIVQETVLKGMKMIFANLQMYDETDLVAALQALMIYNILLIFPSHSQRAIPSIDPSIIVGLQQVVYYTAGTGIVLQEETDHVAPPWESWIHVTSKRRVVFSLYMLHWAYAVYSRLPSFNCEELGPMPAPPAKFLWQARTRREWEGLYSRWLAQWEGREYLQKEFLRVEPGPNLDRRTQMWLEDTDELGMLYFSLINTTEREPEFALPKSRGS